MNLLPALVGHAVEWRGRPPLCFGSTLGLVSQVILQPHLVDLIELGFEPVDVGFFFDQYQFEEFHGSHCRRLRPPGDVLVVC